MELHQSQIKHYFRCPAAFKFAAVDKVYPQIGTGTQAIMREGELFEGYVSGFKEDKDEAELIGRKKPVTIDKIKSNAEAVKPIFAKGKTFVKMSCKYGDHSLGGEADFIGYLNMDYYREYSGLNDSQVPILSSEKAIVDLKYTGSIKRVWDFKKDKQDYLQAVEYVYIHWKNTGELLPFIYVIVESTSQKPIVHIRRVHVSEEFINDWFIPLLDEIITNMEMGELNAQPLETSCCGGIGEGSCWFLDHCKDGRNYIGGFKAVYLEDL